MTKEQHAEPTPVETTDLQQAQEQIRHLERRIRELTEQLNCLKLDSSAMRLSSSVEWQGSVPLKCDLSGEPITDTFIDGAIRNGSWGLLCPSCHELYGIGLGIGRGQRYGKLSDGRWIKTA